MHHLAAGQVWHLIHCKPNGEQLALRNFQNQDFLAFLALKRVTCRKGASLQTQLRYWFPGYMFVAQDPIIGQL